MLTPLEWALDYAEHGWPVFPLYEMNGSGRCSCGNSDCDSPGKHPRTEKGLYAATTDKRRIEEWWSRWPAANIGLRTGSISGILAVDIDPRHGGDDSWGELEMTFGRIPDTPESHTGGGGSHYLFRFPQTPLGNRAHFKPGIDLRGDDGYIVLPASNHASGASYGWDAVLDPFETAPAEVPTWLLDVIQSVHAEDPQPYESRPWHGEVPSGAQRCLDSHPRVRRRFDRDSEGLNDSSSSGVDYSLACMLALRSLTGCDIEETVRASREIAGLDEKRDHYYTLTVGKALVFANNQGDSEWPEPLWIHEPPRPKFPVDSMPDWTQDFIREVATSVGVAVDLPGTAVLGVLSGSLAKKACVEITSSYREPFGLYLCIATPPGDGKTPALGSTTEPLGEWERAERERRRGDIAVEQQAYDRKKKRLAALEKKLSEEEDLKNRAKLLPEAEGLARELAGLIRPDLPRLMTNNFTPPALAAVMAQNQERMMVVTDEGNELFAILAGKHVKNGSDATLFKQAWSEAPYCEDRIGREGSRLERPLLNVIAMIQPAALRGMRGRNELTGLGVMDRFQITMPESRMAPAKIVSVSEAERSHYKEGVEKLLNLPIPETPAVLRLSEDAASALEVFREELNRDVSEEGVLDGLRGIASKLKAYVVRVSGVLHMAEWVGHDSTTVVPIQLHTVTSAIAIVNYWKAQARLVWGYLERDDATRSALKLWRYIERLAAELPPTEPVTFKKQDAWQKTKGVRGSIRVGRDLDAGLQRLIDAHYIRPVGDTKGVYEVNPKALAYKAAL